MMKSKLGFIGHDKDDDELIKDLLNWMENNKADYTNTFLYLTDKNFRKEKLYENKDFVKWKNRWEARLIKGGSLEKSKDLMKKNNPCIIPRNYIVEKILIEADDGNFNNLKKFIDLFKQPTIIKIILQSIRHCLVKVLKIIKRFVELNCSYKF